MKKQQEKPPLDLESEITAMLEELALVSQYEAEKLAARVAKAHRKAR